MLRYYRDIKSNEMQNDSKIAREIRNAHRLGKKKNTRPVTTRSITLSTSTL